MSRQPTYSMSALFLLVTIVGVLAAIVSSPTGGTALFSIRDTNGAAHEWPSAVLAFGGGVLGVVVMAYVSWRWDMLLMAYCVGVGVGLVALRVLLWPSQPGVLFGGAAMILVYASIAALANSRSRRGPENHEV
jgi:hypothetical protein